MYSILLFSTAFVLLPLQLSAFSSSSSCSASSLHVSKCIHNIKKQYQQLIRKKIWNKLVSIHHIKLTIQAYIDITRYIIPEQKDKPKKISWTFFSHCMHDYDIPTSITTHVLLNFVSWLSPRSYLPTHIHTPSKYFFECRHVRGKKEAKESKQTGWWWVQLSCWLLKEKYI